MQQNNFIYANLSERFFAAGIDLALLYFIVTPLSVLLFPIFIHEPDVLKEAIMLVLQKQPELAKQQGAVLEQILNSNPAAAAIIYEQYLTKGAIQFGLIGIFTIPFIYTKGQTLGKFIAGVKVVDAITMKKLTLAQTIIRYLCYAPSVLCLGIGVFSANFNKRRRCWHDVLSDTVVIMDENRWYKRLWLRILGKS